MKKVTLCMPVYNGEKTLEAALGSVVVQSYPIDKIKIFDNASTDNSLVIIEKYAQIHKNIEVYKSEINIGLEGNLTKCILAADNDYCGIVHSDDVYEKDFVLKSIEALEKNADCVASFTVADEIDEKGNFLKARYTPSSLFKKKPSTLNKTDFLSYILKYSNFITCPAVIVRSDVYREKIKLCNVERFKSSADLEMWFRMVEIGPMLLVPEKLMQYRVSTASFSFNLAQVRTHKHDLFIVLDHYMNQKSDLLTNENKEDYYFLSLKDQAFRNLNIIRNKKINLNFVEEVPLKLSIVFKKMFNSKWHFKMAVAILGITTIKEVLKIIRWNKK